MADGVLRVVAENKVKELEREIERLRGELRSKESFHSAAWAEYGSELCAGEMIGEELKIAGDIMEIERKTDLLRKFVQGTLDISEEGHLKQQCDEFDKEIERLNELKSSANGQLEKISAIKNLLAIKF